MIIQIVVNIFMIFAFLGDAALLDAAKKGNLSRVLKLVTPENINCRDSQGRNSTPLHLAGKLINFRISSISVL